MVAAVLASSALFALLFSCARPTNPVQRYPWSGPRWSTGPQWPPSERNSTHLKAIRAIGERGDSLAASQLCDTLLVSRYTDVQWEAAKALAHMGNVAHGPLGRILASPAWYSESVGQTARGADVEQWPLWCATWALAQHPDSQSVEALMQPLCSYYYPARIEAALALARIGRPALPAVKVVLDSGHGYAQARAMWILGQSRDPRGLDVLLRYAVGDAVIERDWLSTFDGSKAARWAFAQTGRRGIKRLLVELEKPARQDNWSGVSGALAEFGAAVIPEMDRASRTATPVMRSCATRTLGGIRDTNAMPLLVRLVSSDDEDVATQALASIAGMGPKRSLPTLKRAARDSRDKVRRAAMRYLSYSRDSSAVLPLTEALLDPDPKLRAISCSALGELGDVRAKPALRQRLLDWDQGVRDAATIALGNLGDEDVVPALVRMHNESGSNNSTALAALVRSRTRRADEALLAMLRMEFSGFIAAELAERHDPHVDSALEPAIRARLSRKDADDVVADRGIGLPAYVANLMAYGHDSELVSIGAAAVEPLNAVMCTDSEPEDRAHAAGLLVRLGDPRGKVGLKQLLESRSAQCRVSAIWAAGMSGDTSLLRPIVAARYDDGPLVDTEYFSPEPSGPRGEYSRESGAREYIRMISYEALAALNDPRAVQPLLADLQDSTLISGRSPAGALGKLGDSATFDALAAFLRTPRGTSRSDVLDALIAISPRRAADVMLTIIDNPLDPLAEHAIYRLAKTRERRAVAPLKRILRDAQGSIRTDAANALTEIGVSAVDKCLLAYLRKTGEFTSFHASSEALASMKDDWTEGVLIRLILAGRYDGQSRPVYPRLPSRAARHAARLWET